MAHSLSFRPPRVVVPALVHDPRLQPRPASAPFPPVRRGDLGGSVRVEIARSPGPRRTAAICAQRTAGVDVDRSFPIAKVDLAVGRKAANYPPAIGISPSRCYNCVD